MRPSKLRVYEDERPDTGLSDDRPATVAGSSPVVILFVLLLGAKQVGANTRQHKL